MIQKDQDSFNRTIQELKYTNKYDIIIAKNAFNRTIQELK